MRYIEEDVSGSGATPIRTPIFSSAPRKDKPGIAEHILGHQNRLADVSPRIYRGDTEVMPRSAARAFRAVTHVILILCAICAFNPSYAARYHVPSYVPRDTHGRIARSPAAKNAFKRANPCPSTGKATGACPGYVVDHVIALCVGGTDAPQNMAWQTTAAAKVKDRTECGR